MSNDKYVLASNGWYYTTNILTTSPTLQASFTGGKLLRRVTGVANGIAAIRITENNLLFDFDFTVSNGGWYATGSSRPAASPTYNSFYSAGNGWRDGGSPDFAAWIAYNIGYTASLTRLVGVFTASGTSAANKGAVVLVGNAAGDVQLEGRNDAIANTGGTLDSGTLSAVQRQYLQFLVQNAHATTIITLTSFKAYGQRVVFRYSSNNGAASTENNVGIYAGDAYAFDTDDFNAGATIAAAQNTLFCSSSYTGAFVAVTGLSGTNPGTALVTCVRVPYRKLATQALNNNASSLQVIYCTNAAVGGNTIFAANIVASTGAVTGTQSTLTPIVSGTTYYVIGANALVTNGDNTRQIVALCKPVGGGSTHILASSDGGSNWSDRGVFDGIYTTFIPAVDGGANGEFIVSGTDGVKHAPAYGSIANSRIGDFVAEAGGNPIGALAL